MHLPLKNHSTLSHDTLSFMREVWCFDHSAAGTLTGRWWADRVWRPVRKKKIARCTFLNETMLSDVGQREFQLYYTRLQTQHPGGCFYCIYWSFQQNLSVKLQLRSCWERKPLVNMNAVWNGCYSTSRNENLNVIFFFLMWKWLRGILPLFFMKIQNLKKKRKKKKVQIPLCCCPLPSGVLVN